MCSGESEVDEAAEVEGGGAVVEPGVVLEDASVGDAAVAFGDEPGDGAFDRWSPAAVFGLPAGVGGGLVAGGFEQVVLGVDAENTAGLGACAAVLERAGGTQLLELGLACAVGQWPSQRAGVSGGAGDLTLFGVNGELVGGEAAGDGRFERRGLEDQVMALVLKVFTQVAGAIGGVAQGGDRCVLVGQESWATAASWLPGPLPAVRATSVNSPASGSKATWARNPSWWRVRFLWM